MQHATGADLAQHFNLWLSTVYDDDDDAKERKYFRKESLTRVLEYV